MNPVYCKYSNDRAPKFQIRTAIFRKENGKKIVQKSPLHPAAKEHVDQIYRHYLQMEESFRGALFTPNKCTKTENGVELEFVEGETLEQYLDGLYHAGRYPEIFEEMKKYRDILYSLSDNIPFQYTEKFKEVFGIKAGFEGLPSLRISNIDLIFCNLIPGERWTVIDYEWILDAPVPIEFIVYRAAHYYLYSSTKRKALQELPVYKFLDISEKRAEIYAEMEKSFQRYVAGSKYVMHELKGQMLRRCEDAQALIRERREDFAQLYMDVGNDFSEEESIKKTYIHGENESIVWETDLKEGMKGLRLDPAASAVMIKDLLILADGKKTDPSGSNGMFIRDGMYVFGTDDPQIMIPVPEGIRHIRISFSVSLFAAMWRADLTDMAKKGRELQEENANLISLNAALEIRKNQAEQYIEQLHNKWYWKVFLKGKKLLKRS